MHPNTYMYTVSTPHISKYSLIEDTCHSEYPQLALPPHFMLMQQKWKQHE